MDHQTLHQTELSRRDRARDGAQHCAWLYHLLHMLLPNYEHRPGFGFLQPGIWRFSLPTLPINLCSIPKNGEPQVTIGFKTQTVEFYMVWGYSHFRKLPWYGLRYGSTLASKATG